MSNKDFDNLPKQPVEVKGVEKPKPAREFLEPYYKTLGDGNSRLLGIETGLAELDEITLGLDGVIVLGGKAGQGKTSLALQLAFDACKLGTPTIFYSLEMPRREIFTKILNRLAEVKYSEILLKGRRYLDKTRQGKNLLGEDTEQADKLKQAKEKLTNTSNKFYLRSLDRGEADIDFESVEREINLIKAEHKADKVLIVIDQLQDFNIDTKEYRDQIDREGKLIRSFNKISHKTGATFILISHKSKAEWQGTDMTSIKGSVDLVYKPKIVLILKSDENEDDKEQDEAETKKIDLVITKHRTGRTGKIELDFNGKYSSFSTRQSKDWKF